MIWQFTAWAFSAAKVDKLFLQEEDAAEGEESEDTDSEEAGEVEDVDDSSEGSEFEDSAITVEINQDQDDLPSVFCECQGCTDQDNAYQLSDKSTLQKLSTQSRNFQSLWFKKFPWLSICSTRKKCFAYIADTSTNIMFLCSLKWERKPSQSMLSKLEESLRKISSTSILPYT